MARRDHLDTPTRVAILEDRVDKLEDAEEGDGSTPDYTEPAAELALEHGVDIRAVPGTGKHGRVLKSNVRTYLENRTDADAQEGEGDG